VVPRNPVSAIAGVESFLSFSGGLARLGNAHVCVTIKTYPSGSVTRNSPRGA
jgi:hypothetical protein